MAARLLRLRVALLLAAFRGRFAVVARRVLLGLLVSALTVVLAWAPMLVTADADERAATDVVLTSFVLAGALLIPFFANRHHLEPRQFGQLPEKPGTVALSLLVTSWLSWPVGWLLLWLLALALLRPERSASWWAALVAAVLALLLATASARVASALAKLVVPRAAVGAVRATGLLLLVAALPVVVFAVAQALRDPESTMTADAARVLGWTPFGAPAAGAALAASGDAPGALIRFGIALAAFALLIIVWFPLVRISLETIDRPVASSKARHGLGWFERFPAKPASVIGARALTYWARDPRYRIGLFAIPLAPIVMVLALWVAGAPIWLLALIPLPVILLLFAWSLHNDVAMDSTAIWMHVASGTRGRDDRIGRLFPVMFLGVPLLLVGSSVTVTVMGDWRVLPAVLGMNLAVLLLTAGVASVFSTLMPYPATRPGDSPFAQPTGTGSGSGLAQTLSMIVAVLLALPPAWVAGTAIADPSLGSNVFALVFGAGYGSVLLAVGVLLGGRIFERVGPELVAIAQTFD